MGYPAGPEKKEGLAGEDGFIPFEEGIIFVILCFPAQKI
jgi:hypothetical protein